MFSLNNRCLLAAGLLLFVMCGWAAADELIMKNGDRMTGTVVSKEGETLQFETEYGGPYEIAWEQVQELRTDEPMTILEENGTVSKTSALQNTTVPDSSTADTTVPDSSAAAPVEFSINPEPWRVGEGYGFSGNINLGAEVDRGNTDKDEFDVGGRIEVRDRKNRVTLSGELEKDKNSGVKTKDKYIARAKYDRFINKRLYLGAYAGIDSDKFAELNERLGFGPLLGYQFYEGAITNLYGELGPAWVSEDFITQPDEEFWAGSWNILFDHYLWVDILQFYHNQMGIWGFEAPNKVVWKSWTGLKVPLFAGIVGMGEVKVEYESDPAPGAETTDTTYRFKFGYEW